MTCAQRGRAERAAVCPLVIGSATFAPDDLVPYPSKDSVSRRIIFAQYDPLI